MTNGCIGFPSFGDIFRSSYSPHKKLIMLGILSFLDGYRERHTPIPVKDICRVTSLPYDLTLKTIMGMDADGIVYYTDSKCTDPYITTFPVDGSGKENG